MIMRGEADGTLKYFQTQPPATEVPKEVAVAVKEMFPGFTAKRVDGMGCDGATFIGCRFEGTTAYSKAEVVVAPPDGTRVVTEAEGAKPPAKK